MKCLLVLSLGCISCVDDGWPATIYERVLICTFELPFLNHKGLTTRQIVERYGDSRLKTLQSFLHVFSSQTALTTKKKY